MAEIDVSLYFGVMGITIAVAIALFSPYYISVLDKGRRKKTLKIALKYEIHQNYLECLEKKGFILDAPPKLEIKDNSRIPAIHGYLHYSAYEAFVLSGFLIEEDDQIQVLIEKIYDEYHTVSHFLATDRDLMSFFTGELLRKNKIQFFNELLNVVAIVGPYKSEFDRIFDVSK